MAKKDQVRKTEKNDVVTRFWYTLENLHLIILIHGHVIIDDMGS